METSNASAERAPAAQTYREVRGLSRGIAVLRALNTMPGGIAGAAELARATVYMC